MGRASGVGARAEEGLPRGRPASPRPMPSFGCAGVGAESSVGEAIRRAGDAAAGIPPGRLRPVGGLSPLPGAARPDLGAASLEAPGRVVGRGASAGGSSTRGGDAARAGGGAFFVKPAGGFFPPNAGFLPAGAAAGFGGGAAAFGLNFAFTSALSWNSLILVLRISSSPSKCTFMIRSPMIFHSTPRTSAPASRCVAFESVRSFVAASAIALTSGG